MSQFNGGSQNGRKRTKLVRTPLSQSPVCGDQLKSSPFGPAQSRVQSANAAISATFGGAPEP